eukprot:c7530_g1_i1.p1 GENE.c7530_g1_i1~~c7530_g1_i1.p1  ORF type:complete len:118 (+),score=33.78 c7530_g1_i1:36-389(+)
MHLRVRVIRARNLVKADRNSSDPFAKVTCEGHSHSTDVVPTTLNPCWNEILEFKLSKKEQIVSIQIFDHDTFSANDPLGHVQVTTNDLEEGVEKVLLLNLEGVASGDIEFGLTFLSK